jgi:hypothetical protein
MFDLNENQIVNGFPAPIKFTLNPVTMLEHGSKRIWGGKREREQERDRAREEGVLAVTQCAVCRGTSFVKTTPPVGPYSSPVPRDLW